MKTSSFLALAASLGLASTVSAQVLMLDFGLTAAAGASLTNSPYHTAAGASFTGNTWNTIGTADPSSTLKFSDNSNSSITLKLGALTFATSTITSTTIDLDNSQPVTSSALGNPTGSGIYDASSIGKDAIFTTSNGTTGATQVGAQIGGLAIGTYDIFITARNTNTGSGANTYTQTVYADVAGAGSTFDYSAYDFETLTYAKNGTTNPSNIYTTAWVDGENYIKLSVSITAVDQFLNLAVVGGGSENRGFLNSIQIVNTTAVPEPSTFAALAGLGALGFVATRRRRAAR